MPDSKVDTKAQAKQAEAIAKDGRWAATESDDNAVFASEEAYIGVEPERQNHAYDEQKPLAASSPKSDRGKAEKAIFDRLAEESADLASRSVTVTQRGTISGGAPHPTERGARPGYVAPTSQESTDVSRTATKDETTGDDDTGTTGENDAAKAEVEKGNTPAPAATPAKD